MFLVGIHRSVLLPFYNPGNKLEDRKKWGLLDRAFVLTVTVDTSNTYLTVHDTPAFFALLILSFMNRPPVQFCAYRARLCQKIYFFNYSHFWFSERDVVIRQKQNCL